MTARRWEKLMIRKNCGPFRVATAAVVTAALLFSTGCSTAEPAESSAKVRPVESVAQLDPIKINGMSIAADLRGVSLGFTATGQTITSLTIDEKSGVATVKVDNSAFVGLGQRVDVGDGVVESVEFVKMGGDSAIKVTLAAPAKVVLSDKVGGFALLISSSAKAVAKPTVKAAVSGHVVVLSEEGVDFELGAVPSELAGFLLSGGERLVVDFNKVFAGEMDRVESFETGPISMIAIRSAGESARAVIHARDASVFSGYTLVKTENGFRVTSGTSLVAQVKGVEVAPIVMAAQASGGGEISDFGFRQDADRSFVELTLSAAADNQVTEATDTRVVLDVKNTVLPKKFQRALDTSAFNGPVKLVAAYQRGMDVRVVIDLKQAAPFSVEPSDGMLVIAFDGGSDSVEEAAPEPTEKLVLVGGQAPVMAGGSADAGSVVTIEGAVPQMGFTPGKYTGQPISMDFVDADIRNVLRIIGEVSGYNIVTGSEVTGKVTVRLVDVPWDQALSVILKAKGLGNDVEGNIMRIVSSERLDAERDKVRKDMEAIEKEREEKTPLVSDIFPVNYADAQDVSSKVESVLSERGSVSVDERTNTILIRDLPEIVEIARELVVRLDTPTPQVLIEARVVEVSTTYSKDLGVQWGADYTASAATGNATGASFPNSIGLSGDTGGTSNYAVNLPSTAGSGGGAGAALALNLGHIKDIFSLDLRLSALESTGKGRVVSSPRITTLDNKKATISQGISIPFTTATDEKIETSSIDYLLELNVTPHVTSDNSILLSIQIKKDAPSTTFFAIDSSTPAKETRVAETEVLVRDGETAVIGGIITDTQSYTEANIPWFHKIPFLGWMFQSQDKKIDKTEMIIFITPKIVRFDDGSSSL